MRLEGGELFSLSGDPGVEGGEAVGDPLLLARFWTFQRDTSEIIVVTGADRSLVSPLECDVRTNKDAGSLKRYSKNRETTPLCGDRTMSTRG